VIIPLFNSTSTLVETLSSLRAQAWPNLEIIGIDDGSSDHSAELFQQHCQDARLLRQPNRGPSHARNAGLAEATGKYIAFLDSDDLWPDGKLAWQVNHLEAEPALFASLGYMHLFMDQPDPVTNTVRRQWGRPSFLFLLGCMVARRELFSTDHVGNFDAEQFPFNGEDTDWFLRAWESASPMEISEETTLLYRRRKGSLSNDPEDTKRGFAGLMMASLRRRRDPSGKVRPLPSSLRFPGNLLARP